MDIKIINGTIVDGTGQARYKSDIGITGDTISDIGDLSAAEAEYTIDAAGKIVAPGFIDVHTHSDFSIIFDGSATSRLYDGVTSDVIGNCGIGGAPVNDETRDLLRSYLVTRIAGSVPVADLGLKWNSFGEYLEFLDRCPKGINIIPLLSHGAVRIDAMGFSDSKPSRSELERMKRSIRESMEAGACGFSSGLVYLPGMYADAEELTELSRVAAEFGVKYITHMRNEGNTIQEALEEAAAIGRDSGPGCMCRISNWPVPRSGERPTGISRRFKNMPKAVLTSAMTAIPTSAAWDRLRVRYPAGASRMVASARCWRYLLILCSASE